MSKLLYGLESRLEDVGLGTHILVQPEYLVRDTNLAGQVKRCKVMNSTAQDQITTLHKRISKDQTSRKVEIILKKKS